MQFVKGSPLVVDLPGTMKLRLVPATLCLAVGILGFFCFRASTLLEGAESLPYVITQKNTNAPAEFQVIKRSAGANDDMVVSQKGRAFVPAQITIKAHRRITITNDDDTAHHVFCSSESYKYTSGPMPVGASVTLTFSEPGTYELRCAIHPQMLLTVVVTPLGN